MSKIKNKEQVYLTGICAKTIIDGKYWILTDEEELEEKHENEVEEKHELAEKVEQTETEKQENINSDMLGVEPRRYGD